MCTAVLIFCGNMLWDRGSEMLPIGGPSSCAAGEYPVTIGEREEVRLDACAPCLPGTFKRSAGADRCVPCEPGWFSEGGAAECAPCGAGEKSAAPADPEVHRDGTVQAFGPAACVACEPGRISTLGAAECSPCPAGTAARAGAECELCEAGSFASAAGSAACAPCPAGLTTRDIGRVSADACVCGPDRYRVEAGTCAACGEGLDCAGAALRVASRECLPSYFVSETSISAGFASSPWKSRGSCELPSGR